MSLPMRNEVPVGMTWDLSLIYPSLDAMKKDAEKARQMTADMEKKYDGHLTDPQTIISCLEELEQVMVIEDLTFCYADLAASVDYYDSEAQNLQTQTESMCAEIGSRLSFIDSQLLTQPAELLQAAAEAEPRFRRYISDLIRRQPHQLSPETEKVLAALAPAFRTPEQIYNMSKLADMKFPPFELKGKEYPMGYSLFEDDYEYDPDPEVRRAAFRAFYDMLRRYENTTAAAYNAQVRTEKMMADLRGFDSVFDSLLFGQKVTREMYDRQIDLITEKLAPHMRRYAKLLQKKHGLDRMTYADLKIAVDPDYDPSVSLEDCRKYVTEGLSILGQDYTDMVREAFEHRWFDFARNQGKMTGGFCASPYRKGSFILTTWNNRIADVFTVAHELGHAGHFRMCNAAQSILNTDVSSYLVEAPSTTNELIMAHHLLKTNKDPRFRRWVLSSMISCTYYHNFVTHLLEAWYQREVYRIVDAGGSVSAETLNDIFRRNLENFWGPEVEIPEGAELTWMRQPHYYMGLYSYTYSAGLTLGTQVCKRIEREGAPAVEDWKRMLAAGATEDPLGLARIAGIDLSTDGPLLDTIETIGGIIEEIIAITGEIDGIKID